jgi:hypothetical protein
MKTKQYENYKKMKREHQAEIDNFPMFFAFGNDQFDENIKKVGLTPEDTDKILSIGYGGFIRKKDREKFLNMMERHDKELQQAIKEDKTGEGFIKDMFLYELGNHEYIVTGRFDDTLDAVGLTLEEVKENEALEHGLIKARNEYIRRFDN